MVVGGDEFDVILVSSILVLYANDAWLLSIWCRVTMPCWGECATAGETEFTLAVIIECLGSWSPRGGGS
jgi:hypothetical protein